MSFFTDRKTLVVGALSLVTSVSAVLVTSQSNASSVPFFTQSVSTTQMTVRQQQVNQQQSYILQGLSRDALVAVVENAGGVVSREFPIISAVSAYLSDSQISEIAKIAAVKVTADRAMMTMADNSAATDASANVKKYAIDNYITTQTKADLLHQQGITGQGVTVAVIDSGSLMGGKQGESLLYNTNYQNRAFDKYDAITGVVSTELDDDLNGHGSHVTGIIASSLKSDSGKYNGMAPDVYLLSVKAFDETGNGSYSDVLNGLNYVFENRERLNIRVVNMSLGAEVQSNYWEDPINQAVMRLWDAGVVVVTSVGNTGSDYNTVTLPSNVPYVISVGAITDSYTPFDTSDDRMTTFSSRGPTYEGFIKPEVVSYGGHIRSKLDKSKLIKQNHAPSEEGEDYYMVSGTSQAAAVVTGVVALMLQHDPALSPDDVKCRLMASASAITNPDNGYKYGPFTQGSGLVDAYAATMSQATGCANNGLDLVADLIGSAHFEGPAQVADNGEIYIKLSDTTILIEGAVMGSSAVLEGSVWDVSTGLQGSVWDVSTGLQGSVWDVSTGLQGSVWDVSTGLQGSVWDVSTGLQGSVWDVSTGLQGSVWDVSTGLQGSVWDVSTGLQGSVWDVSTGLQGSVWDRMSALEGSVWDTNAFVEGFAWKALAAIESVANVDEKPAKQQKSSNDLLSELPAI
ncbi:S8 family peptidase [Aliiglaciecola sp. LCG003]|uniref:S8 family peptidase n=1 Tax=Aliiglaciecola sp. LCG003 TaxID=3053655 RepID=UPI0025730806|nr:S8 family peptidase [Aliiglaciecola sp. LCG003]WJG08505.1 S8 family peptidase [Aliiglaciecola sp. LCG003]